MYRFAHAQQLYRKLLPSFILMASHQSAKETWKSMPSIAAQAAACTMTKSLYIETVKQWACCKDNPNNVIEHCLAHLAKIEREHFNSLTTIQRDIPSYIELVDEASITSSHHWQVRIPTPFGVCGVGGRGDVIIDTDFLNLNSEDKPEHIKTAERIFLFYPEDKIKIADTGSTFTRKIRRRLLSLPKGYHLSYGRLAEGRAARAVGSAMRNNPYSVVVPCHRVLGHNFSLSGYAGGESPKQCARKIAIILYERLHCELDRKIATTSEQPHRVLS